MYNCEQDLVPIQLCTGYGTDTTEYRIWYRYNCVQDLVPIQLCTGSGTNTTVYGIWYRYNCVRDLVQMQLCKGSGANLCQGPEVLPRCTGIEPGREIKHLIIVQGGSRGICGLYSLPCTMYSVTREGAVSLNAVIHEVCAARGQGLFYAALQIKNQTFKVLVTYLYNYLTGVN